MSAVESVVDPDFKEIDTMMRSLKRKADADLKDERPQQKTKAVASASASAAAPPPSPDTKSLEGKTVTFGADQLRTIELAQKGRNLWITGRAGTGKTTLVQHMIDMLRDKGESVYSTALISIAAILIPGGMTFHKFFGVGICDRPLEYYVFDAQRRMIEYLAIEKEVAALSTDPKLADQLAMKKKALEAHPLHRLVTADVIFIDEIVALKITHLRKALAKLKVCRKHAKKKMPQIIFMGCLFQGKPINPEPRCSVDDPRYKEYVINEGFLLDSPDWKELNVEEVELRQVFRQSDVQQVDVLDHVRCGLLFDKHVEFLNSLKKTRTKMESEELKAKTAAEKEGRPYVPPITLSAIKTRVAERNRKMLDQLPGTGLSFTAHAYYIQVDRNNAGQEEQFWHCKCAMAAPSTPGFSNEKREPVVAFETKLDDDNDSKTATMREFDWNEQKNVMDQLVDAFRDLQIELNWVTKPNAAVIVTRTIVPELVVNGTRGSIVSATGFEEFGETNRKLPGDVGIDTINQCKIKMYKGLPPSTVPYPSIELKVDDLEDAITVGPTFYEFPTDPGQRNLDRSKWTAFVRVVAFPCLTGWALTIHKTIGMTFDGMTLDAESIRKHGETCGLFYLGLSRARDLKRVSLLGFDADCIAARAHAVRYFRKTLPVFKDIEDDKEFEDMLAQGARGKNPRDRSFFLHVKEEGGDDDEKF